MNSRNVITPLAPRYARSVLYPTELNNYRARYYNDDCVRTLSQGGIIRTPLTIGRVLFTECDGVCPNAVVVIDRVTFYDQSRGL